MSANAAHHASSIAVILATDKSVYRVGEDVRLKISVRNTSSEVLDMFFSGPHNDSKLMVKDDSGATVGPNIPPEGPLFDTSGSVTNAHLQPGETVPDTRYALGMPVGMNESDGFVSSRWWGYSFTKAGRYTLAAVRVLGVKVFSSPSNVVVITVNP